MRFLLFLIAVSVFTPMKVASAGDGQHDLVVGDLAMTGSLLTRALTPEQVVEFHGGAHADIFKVYSEKRAIREKLLKLHDAGKLILVEQNLAQKSGKKLYSLKRLDLPAQIRRTVITLPDGQTARFLITTELKNTARISSSVMFLYGTLKAAKGIIYSFIDEPETIASPVK